MNASPDPLLSRPDLRVRFNCSISSIKRYEALGLKSLKIGPRLVRYRMADVIAFEQKQGGR